MAECWERDNYEESLRFKRNVETVSSGLCHQRAGKTRNETCFALESRWSSQSLEKCDANWRSCHGCATRRAISLYSATSCMFIADMPMYRFRTHLHRPPPPPAVVFQSSAPTSVSSDLCATSLELVRVCHLSMNYIGQKGSSVAPTHERTTDSSYNGSPIAHSRMRQNLSLRNLR